MRTDASAFTITALSPLRVMAMCRTAPADFRRLLNEIAGLLTYEGSRRFDARAVPVETLVHPGFSARQVCPHP